MGTAAGSEECITNVIRFSLRYGNIETLENGCGINVLTPEEGLDHNSAHLVQSRRRSSLLEHCITRENPHGPAGLGRIFY